MTPHGHYFWTELNTWDVEAAKAFYAATIGWTYQDASTKEGGEYWLAMANGEPVAGILPLTSPTFDGFEDFWAPYIAVEDVDQCTAEALAKGALIVRDFLDVPNTGRRVILKQPGGALVALMTQFAE